MIMDRRYFIRSLLEGAGTLCVLGLAACGRDPENDPTGEAGRTLYRPGTVILYDTYAMALYMDGGLGPKTGIIKTDYVIANQPLTLDFWHGHGGKNHKFTVTPEHFKTLKSLKKVTITTTEVENHSHKLFIDPVDPKWRVPGAKPIEVPIDPPTDE